MSYIRTERVVVAMKLSRFHIAAVIILIAAAVTVYIVYASDNGQIPGDRMAKFKEFAVTRGTFRAIVSASGVVQPINRIEIKSKASGLIEEMQVEEGDFVKAGDLICRLDQTDVQAEVDQARADLDIAQAELKMARNTYDRRQALFEKNLISREELDETELGLAQAKGRLVRATTSLDQANVRLSETVVTAPSDGVILKKFVEAGQIISSGINSVSGGTAIAAIADMQHVYIEAGIDEIDVGKVRIGQKAIVGAEAYPDMTFEGEIIRMAPEAKVEQNVTLFDVVIEVENRAGLLKSGMNASVEVTVVVEHDVLLAPAMALQPFGEGPSARNKRLTMIKRDGRFMEQVVEIGNFDFSQVVIVSGLDEGDTVGVEMRSRLKDENDRMAERIRSSRSFGASNSNNSSDSSRRQGSR